MSQYLDEGPVKSLRRQTLNPSLTTPGSLSAQVLARAYGFVTGNKPERINRNG